MTNGIVIGAVARTGSAITVALSGTGAAPRFLARREIELVPRGLSAQPYHTAADLDLATGEELIAQVETAAEDAATAGLRALADTGLADTGPAGVVRAVAVVVKPVSVPGDLAGILRSHAWMHAAEGVLYRRAVLAAATACGCVSFGRPPMPTAEDPRHLGGSLRAEIAMAWVAARSR